MRNRTPRVLFSMLFALGLLLLTRGAVYGQSVTPLLQATVGTGTNTSYFVLDFNSGPSPQSYAFAYLWDGSQTGGDMLNALEADVPGFSFTYQTYTFPGFPPERFFTSFTYNGETVTPPDSNSYWLYWLSTDGLNWSEPDSYTSDNHPLVNGGYESWTYAPNGVATAPITPLTSAAAPEPGTLALALLGGSGLLGAIASRRLTAAPV